MTAKSADQISTLLIRFNVHFVMQKRITATTYNLNHTKINGADKDCKLKVHAHLKNSTKDRSFLKVDNSQSPTRAVTFAGKNTRWNQIFPAALVQSRFKKLKMDLLPLRTCKVRSPTRAATFAGKGRPTEQRNSSRRDSVPRDGISKSKPSFWA